MSAASGLAAGKRPHPELAAEAVHSALAKADLTQAVLAEPRLNFTKPAGRPAQAELRVVLEQDRVMLETMEPDANQREHLYEHDIGLSRLRKTMQNMALKQLTAAK